MGEKQQLPVALSIQCCDFFVMTTLLWCPGVWLEGSDGTDINALCRSHSERVVAVADDFCKVHLFQYPCPKPKVGHIVFISFSVMLFWKDIHCHETLSLLFFLTPRHRVTSMKAMAAMSPTSASPTVIPTCSPWVGRTPASSSGEWWEAGQGKPGRDWPQPYPPPPAPQN